MTYHKMTCISGRDAAGRYVNSVRAGHWRPEAAERAARRMMIVGPVKVTHSTADMSGRGRGGYDRKCVVNDGRVTALPLSAYELDVNAEGDADDVHALYDSR